MATSRTVYCVVIITCSLVLPGCSLSQPKDAAEAIGTYADAKQKFAKALDAAVSAQPDNKYYHLVAIIGPAYPIGYLLRHDAPSPLTKVCQVPEGGVLKDTTWTPIPEYSSEYAFSLGGSATIPKVKVLSTIPTVSASVKRNAKALFAYTDLTQDLAYEDSFEKALSAQNCKSAIAKAFSEGRPVVAIRGIVNGKERISSEGKLGTEAKIELLKDQNLTMSYDNKGGYKVEDAKPGPRFYVITTLTPSVSAKGGYDLRSPTPAEVQALGGLQ